MYRDFFLKDGGAYKNTHVRVDEAWNDWNRPNDISYSFLSLLNSPLRDYKAINTPALDL